VAVGSDHHGDLDALITQSGDASGPFSFNHGSPLKCQAKLGEKGDGVIEGFHAMPTLSIRSNLLLVMISVVSVVMV
jgi:hypothetical protein